jgi:hypothetical protein
MKKLVYLLSIVLFSGCMAMGARYDEAMKTAPELQGRKARLFFFRTTETKLYAMRAAAVKIDEASAGDVPIGGFFYLDIDPGRHVIKTDMWDLPGSCEVILTANGGRMYYFEVTARMESYKHFMIGGYVGSAIEVSQNECSGAFAVIPVEEKDAQDKMADLKQSK